MIHSTVNQNLYKRALAYFRQKRDKDNYLTEKMKWRMDWLGLLEGPHMGGL